MNADQSQIWASVDLHEQYLNFVAVPSFPLTQCQFIPKLNDNFEDVILETNIDGCTNLIYLRQYAPYKLCEVADNSWTILNS